MIKRYSGERISRIFSDDYRYKLWLKIELAVTEAWAKEGRIPEASYRSIKKLARYSPLRIRELERTLEHEVIAFTTSVSESFKKAKSPTLSRYFHLGLTSSDVMDTALSLQIKEAFSLILHQLEVLLETIKKLAIEHKYTLMIGRTHGIHAEPITFGLKALIWLKEIERAKMRLEFAREETCFGKISGAVGNYAHIPPSVEEYALRKIGLKPSPVSNQIIQRDRHASTLCALAILAGSLEKIALEIRNLQRTEIGEVFEPFGKGQKGSSAMPHKRNPVLCERMSGLARLMRAYAHVALDNQPTWHERDISHSSAERVAIADAFILADYMLSKMNYILSGLEVDPVRMKKNLEATRGQIYSQRVLLALTEKGLSREEAYRIVQSTAIEAVKSGKHLSSVLKANKVVRELLTSREILRLFDPKPYLVHIDEIFSRALSSGDDK